MTAAKLSLTNRQRAIVLALLVCAGAIRLVFVTKVMPNLAFGDESEYLDGARRLLAGQPLAQKNWMLFVRAPGYSTFIALIWKLVGSQSLGAVRIAQALLATATCAYVWAMARLLDDRPWVAAVSLAAATFYPYHVFYAASLGTETVFAFTVAAGIYHLARGLEATPRYLHLVLAATLLALGNLARPNLSTLLPLLGIWLLIRYRGQLRRVVAVGAALLVPILFVTLPWTFAVHEQGLGWMWVTDGGPVWYFMGHNDDARRLLCDDLSLTERRELNGFPGEGTFTRRAEYQEALAAPPTEQQAVFMRDALRWDRAHLGAQPCLAWHKLVGYWRPFVNPDNYAPKMVAVSATSLPVLALGLLGLWTALRRRRGGALPMIVLLNVVVGTATAVMASTEIRYRIPLLDVLLLGFVGYGVAVTRARLDTPRTTS